MEDRLQKILAQWGVASRRHAEQMIVAGRVQLNGQVATLGQKADPERDRISVDGQILGQAHRPELLYILLNKPLHYVTTCSDPWGRPTVLDLLPLEYQQSGLHPVGRLDAQSTGALLLTNDGDLTFHLTHPTHSVSKTYEVQVRGKPSTEVLAQWRKGVLLEGRMTRPAQVRAIENRGGNCGNTDLEIVLQEGRKRQIRLVAKSLGHPVLKLHRTHIGPLGLEDSSGRILGLGGCRVLTSSEIEELRHIIEYNDRIENRKEAPV
jgi:23S rRNA pseudouridine2605 synthase